MILLKKIFLLLLVLFVLAGSSTAFASETVSEKTFTYDFFGLRFKVSFVEGAAILYLPEGPLELPQALSGSGARYTDGETTFWIKGENACMEVNGSVADRSSEESL